MKKTIVIVLNIAGLSPCLLGREETLPNIIALKRGGTYRKMIPTFPAVTCSVQASLLSGKPPRDHGIVGNGYFDPNAMRPKFWPQENTLVNGPRIWDIMRERDPKAKVAVIFWQNSKYIDADVVITPSPLHTDAGMIEWCYSKPRGLYERLTRKLGPFSLKHYWGPLAGAKSSQWIAKASLEVLKTEQPDMLLVYIPHLDYVCQRVGPESTQTEKELSFVDNIVGDFMEFRKTYGEDHVILFIVSEYGFTPVKEAVCPNLVLRESGLLKTYEIAGKEYIDFELSDAFAVVDHQVAHIYCKRKALEKTRGVLVSFKGIARVLDRDEQCELEIYHQRSGDLIVVSQLGEWFAYYYWFDEKKAPFYAHTVDIHNKPGYDPCELFLDDDTKTIPIRPQIVKGSHGLSAEADNQLAIMVCSERSLHDYAPEPFNASQFLAVLYTVI